MKARHNRNFRLLARRAVVAVCCAALIGCYSFRPVGGPAPQLQDEIRAGRLVKVGESVKITTTDGSHYEFEVRAIDDTSIRGAKRTVPIDEIARIERSELNAWRTLFLVGGIVVMLIGIASTADMSPSFSGGSWGSASAGGG